MSSIVSNGPGELRPPARPRGRDTNDARFDRHTPLPLLVVIAGDPLAGARDFVDETLEIGESRRRAEVIHDALRAPRVREGDDGCGKVRHRPLRAVRIVGLEILILEVEEPQPLSALENFGDARRRNAGSLFSRDANVSLALVDDVAECVDADGVDGARAEEAVRSNVTMVSPAAAAFVSPAPLMTRRL